MGQRFSLCAKPVLDPAAPTKEGPVLKESDALLAPAAAPAAPPKKKPGVDGLDLCGGKLHVPATLVVAFVVLTYGCLSVGFNIYNSFLLRIVPGFKFPVVYTTTHMFAGFIGASTLIFGFGAGTVSWERFTQKWRPLLLLACFRSGTIVLNNWSLVRQPCHAWLRASGRRAKGVVAQPWFSAAPRATNPSRPPLRGTATHVTHVPSFSATGAHRPDTEQGDQVDGAGVRGGLLRDRREEEVHVAGDRVSPLPLLRHDPLVPTLLRQRQQPHRHRDGHRVFGRGRWRHRDERTAPGEGAPRKAQKGGPAGWPDATPGQPPLHTLAQKGKAPRAAAPL